MRRLLLLIVLGVAACGAPDAPQAPPQPAASPSLPPAVIAATIAALPTPYDAGDYDNGRRLFAQCRACHTLEAGGANRVGPNLHGMMGRPAASVAAFPSYSQGLKDSGVVWDAGTLDRWIADPRAVVSVNNMIFPGIRKPEDRRDLIAYIAVETAD